MNRRKKIHEQERPKPKPIWVGLAVKQDHGGNYFVRAFDMRTAARRQSVAEFSEGAAPPRSRAVSGG